MALSTVRARKGAFAGAFVSLVLATALVAACGILLETGVRAGIETERYRGTPLVVAGTQRVTPEGEDVEVELSPERARIDAGLVERIAGVDGVAEAIPEVTFPARIVTGGGSGAGGGGQVLGGPAGRDAEDHSWGHAWTSAALTPFTLADGTAPSGAGEVVLDAELAGRAGVGVGDRVVVQATAEPREYRVSGVATPAGGGGLDRQSALFFSPGDAERLARSPGRVDAIGVVPERGADVDAVRDRVRDELAADRGEAGDPGEAGGAGVRVLAGDDRGAAEFLDAAGAREELIAIAASFGGVALMVALFVVASTFALIVQQRTREVALLRAVAATPRQVRRMICREAQVVALVAGVVGAVPAAAVAGWLRGQFVERGLLPESFALYVGPLPVLVAIAAVMAAAWLAAWTAARRASRIDPVRALGEAAVEPKPVGRVRLVAGVLVLGAGVGLLALATQLPGEAAAGVGVSVVIPLVTAAALLGPVLARVAATVLGGPLRLLSRRSGYLAVANTRANTRRLGSVITPLVLALGVAGVVLFQQTTIDRAAERQARDGMLADRVIVGDPGLPPDVVDAVADLPGVASAAAVAQTGVTVEYTELGDPTAQSFTAQGVDPGALGRTLDLDVTDGSLADLGADVDLGADGDSTGDGDGDATGTGTVAVGRLAAETIGAEVGERVPLWLGDGTRVEPTVVAVYDRGIGFGDFTFPASALDGHLSDALDDMVLVELSSPGEGADVDAALADLPYAGLTVLDRDGFRTAQAETRALDAWMHLLLGGVLLGYIAISVANSLVVGTSARARELALLRLVGSTRRQVQRMMRWEAVMVVATALVVGGVIAATTLAMLAYGITGDPRPHVPPLAGLALVAAVVTLGMASIALPTRHALRTDPTEAIGLRE